MNDVSSPAPGASLIPDSISLITSAHFILIALFALAVVAMIIVGIARKRRRKEADADLEERIEQAEVEAAEEPVASTAQPDSAPQGDAPAFALTQLKGLGPKVAIRLEELGITSVAQLAALDDTAAARIDAQLGTFAGRMTRDRWVEQAGFLAAGDRTGFEARFGKL